MIDPVWTKLVDDVLWGVTGNKVEADRIRQRLRDDGDMGIFRRAWHEGGDPTMIGGMIRRAAEQLR